MAKRKSASGGQSQGPPKQAAGGGTSRSSNPQAANMHRPVNTGQPQKFKNAPSKPTTSSGTGAAPRPPQPQVTAHRPPNGSRSQGPSNGAPKSQGANGQPSNFSARVEAMSGPRASQGSMNEGAPKRNISGPNNHPQKAQGHQSNGSSKQQAPKPPKNSQPFVGGHSPAVLPSPAPPRPPHPGNVQHVHVPKAHGTSTAGNKVFQDPSSTSKQSGHTHPHVQKTQNHVQTSPKTSQQQSGKNTANNTFPKVQVAETHAQQSSRGGQSSASSAKNPGNPSHKAQQQKAPSHSFLVKEISNQGHHKNTPPKPQTKDQRQGQPPTESMLPKMLSSFFSYGSEGPRNPPNKTESQQHKAAPTHSRPVQEVSNKGHKDTPPKPSTNNGLPNVFFSTESKGPGNLSHKSQASQHRAPHSRPVQEASNKGHKDGPPKPSTNNQGRPPTESVLPKVSFFTESKDTGNRSSNFIIPTESKHNSSIVGSGSLHSQTAKKHGLNVNQGTASVPQAAASPGLFGTLASWFFPSAPSVDKRAQATSQPTSSSRKATDAGPKPQVPKSSKDNDGSSKSHHAPILPFISPESLNKKPISPTKGINNGLVHDLQNRSSTFALSHTTSKPQVVQGSSTVEHNKSTVPQRKEFPVQSGSSKVLSQHPEKTTTPPKDLIRQHGPTLIWRAGDTPGTLSAYSTLTAAPVPSPPKNELQNKVARGTISKNSDLFKVVSPIKADVFKEHLTDHPNKPFVESVYRGLKKGFWPWADTSDPSFPTTYDGSGQRSPSTSKDSDKAKFIKQQCEEEMNLERWSKPFGENLLPGMHSSPISAVPKSTAGKFRLIVNQSKGPHSLNSTIPRSQVKVKLDSIHDLGNKLLAVREKHPKKKICLWKSDVKSAYRQLPVHPLWQIKQAVSVDGQYYIDRCNTFGNRGGGWNWDSFISLVNWIGTEKKGISDLCGYVDDNFGWEFEGNKQYYKRYKKHLPTKQARLLELWDDLGIPHDEEKQLSGPSLRILGYDVDANAMTVKVPDEKKAKVVQTLRSHAHEGKPYTINELQSVAGSVSSALNLYPQLRPGLRVLFDEMAVQKPGTTKLKVTKDVARSLSGLASYLEDAPPVRIQQQKKSVHGSTSTRAMVK